MSHIMDSELVDSDRMRGPREVWREFAEAIRPALEHVQELIEEFAEHFTEMQDRAAARDRSLVYKRPPHVLTHNITHTHTTPPKSMQLYRRRTP